MVPGTKPPTPTVSSLSLLGWTATCSSFSVLPPLPSVTVTLAYQTPGVVYAWIAVAVLALPPSPKSHS